MKPFLLLLLLFPCLIISSFSSAQSWDDVGGGTNNSSHGMLVWDGKLVNLGSFNNPCNRVALWNGTSWECLGGGVGIVARAGTVWNGNLVVVGDFWNVQQPCTNCNGIAMWNGTQWTNIGAGFNNDVLCVTVWNGDLVAAGDFTQSNGEPCSRIARWTGTTWEQIGPNNAFNNDIRAITEFEGELWVGGDFSNVGGCSACDGLVKWNGSSWVGGNSGVDLSGGVDTTVRVLYVSPTDGRLYMGGHFRGLTPNGVYNANLNGVAVYDGSDWFALGNGVGDNPDDYVRAINEYNGQIVVGGYFTTASGLPANKIARFNLTSQTWSAMGLGFDGVGVDEYVKSAAVWNGIFFAGGAYTQAEGGPMDYIAQWYEPPVAAPIAAMNAEQPSICAGSCASFSDLSTYNPTSWSWSFPGATVTSSNLQNPPPVCYNTPGTYTVTLTACNSVGCNTTTEQITVNASATVDVNNPTVCSGSTTLLTADPSITGGTFLWSPGGQTTSSITVSPTSNTTYTVTYTSPGCGTANATSTVTVIAPPTVTANNVSICQGANATLTATPSVGGGDFLWSPGGQTTASIVVSPTVTTTYSVTYEVGQCTSQPTTATVTVQPAPSVSVNNQTICTGASATLTATPSTGGGTYLWSPGGQTSSSINVTPTSTTSYSVVYTLNGCSTPAATGTVTVNSTAAPTVNSQSICLGNNATLTATPSVTGGTFLWSPGGQTTPSINVSPTTTTTYSVVYTLNGCQSLASSGTVTVNNTAAPSVNNPTICAGNTANLTATPVVGGGTFLWSPGGQTTSSINVSPSSTTTYSVVYTLNGCTSTSSFGTVTVNSTAAPTINNETICAGNSATLTASPSVGGGTYLWSPGGQTSSSITVTPNSTTTYSVIYTLNGCASPTATGTVTVNSTQAPSVNDQTICSGNSAILTATPAVTGGSYLWSPDGQTTQSITVSPASTTTYSVIYTLNGCSSAAGSGIVTVTNQPTVSLNDISVCSGNSVTLTAQPSVGGGTYLWSPGGQSGQSIDVNPLSTSTYQVSYTIPGCPSAVASSVVTVSPTPSVSVNSPTICAGETVQLLCSSDLTGGTYSWTPGGETTTSITVSPITSTTYTVEHTVNGCSGIANGTVTVTPIPTTGVTVSNEIMTVDQQNASYQWLDCDNGMNAISGATAQTFAPTVDGNYAVEVTLNGCSAVSDCSTFQYWGVTELNNGIFNIYPNPSENLVYVVVSEEYLGEQLELIDNSGRRVSILEINDVTIEFNLEHIESGIYQIRLAESPENSVRLIKL